MAERDLYFGEHKIALFATHELKMNVKAKEDQLNSQEHGKSKPAIAHVLA